MELHFIFHKISGGTILERHWSEDTSNIPVVSEYFQGSLTIKRKIIPKKGEDIFDSVIISWPDQNSVEVQFILEKHPDQSYSWKANECGKLELFCASNAPKSWLIDNQSKKLIRWSSESLGDQAILGKIEEKIRFHLKNFVDSFFSVSVFKHISENGY